MSRHALAVGATGMLAPAVRELAEQGWTLTLVARDRRRLTALARPGAVVPVSLDYRDVDGLLGAVRSARSARGPFELVVALIHDTPPGAHERVADEVGSDPPGCHYLEVLGSAHRDPATLGRERARRLARLPWLHHTRVLLGYGADGRRWLTHTEISRGVLDAVAAPAGEHVVGTLAPFRRPGHGARSAPSPAPGCAVGACRS